MLQLSVGLFQSGNMDTLFIREKKGAKRLSWSQGLRDVVGWLDEGGGDEADAGNEMKAQGSMGKSGVCSKVDVTTALLV